MNVPRTRRFSRDKAFAVTVLLLVTAGLYGHTLHVPFYLDDNALFNGTYLLRDLPAAARNLFSGRGLTNLTFALNYHLTGWALFPLHLINILLHALCGLLVWMLLRQLVAGSWLPLVGALLFVAHPLQTQAVTYLAQRSTTLAAGFFLLAVLCHRQANAARLLAAGSRSTRYWWRWHLAAIIAGACAVLSKENAAALPLVLIAHDRLLDREKRGGARRALLDYLPFFIVPLSLGSLAVAGLAAQKAAGFSHYPLASLEHNGPLHYLVTQFSVMWVYLRLLLLPYGQALEHDYPVVAQLLTPQNAIALAGLLLIGWLVWRGRHHRPLLAFGAAWFFLTLAVESSVIPLDPLFEHRLYLPLAGLVLVLLDGLPVLLGERRALVALGLAVLVCLPLAWRRNAQWNDPVAFYEDNLRVVPGSERAMIDLAFRYKETGRLGDMRRLLTYAIEVRPKNHEFYNLLAQDDVDHGRYDEALALLEHGIRLMPDNVELYERAALVAEQAGRSPLIFDYLQRGLTAAKTGKWRLLNDLGIYQARAGDLAQAEALYRQSLDLYADNPVAYQYLGELYNRQGRLAEALAMLKAADRIEPGNPETLDGLAKVAHRVGDEATASRAERILNRIIAREGSLDGGRR